MYDSYKNYKPMDFFSNFSSENLINKFGVMALSPKQLSYPTYPQLPNPLLPTPDPALP